MNERFKNLKGISDIVDAMIQGLKNQWVQVDMDTYGGVSRTNTCFGCAATNTVCQLMNEAFTKDNIGSIQRRAEQFNYGISPEDLSMFESAINELRVGNLACFLRELVFVEHLFSFKLPELDDIKPHFELPHMSTDSYSDDLPEYERYRDWLKEKGL